MSDTLIKVDGLYKKFCRSLKRSMYYGTMDTVRSMMGLDSNEAALRTSEFWALEDINFELKRGETLGLIGQNGCGKTTLLRLLNGIFPPDLGKITINGRIGALIAVGAGFHPHMTGRENIYLNGTILGMSKIEIKRKFEEIVDFAEIGDFLDAPVATYSSGMTVRLGFAIAIHCEPSILLVDEILAVGDVSFVGKCFNRIKKLQDNGTGIIIVSHSTQALLDFCTRGLFLNYGKQLLDSSMGLAIKEYEIVLNNRKTSDEFAKKNSLMANNKQIDAHVYIEDINGTILEEVDPDQKVIFCYRINSTQDLENCFITLTITTTTGIGLIHIRNDNSQIDRIRIKKGMNLIKVFIESLNLEGGAYRCMFFLLNREDDKPIMDHTILKNPLLIRGFKKSENIIKVNCSWQIS